MCAKVSYLLESPLFKLRLHFVLSAEFSRRKSYEVCKRNPPPILKPKETIKGKIGVYLSN